MSEEKIDEWGRPIIGTGEMSRERIDEWNKALKKMADEKPNAKSTAEKLGFPDYQTPANTLLQRGKEGDYWAHYSLGMRYAEGAEDLQQSWALARLHLHIAAEYGGVVEAMDSLGLICRNGKGCLIDFQEAIKWFTKASDLGSEHSTLELARMHLYGQGFPANREIATQMCERLMQSTRGNPYAEKLLREAKKQGGCALVAACITLPFIGALIRYLTS